MMVIEWVSDGDGDGDSDSGKKNGNDALKDREERGLGVEFERVNE